MPLLLSNILLYDQKSLDLSSHTSSAFRSLLSACIKYTHAYNMRIVQFQKELDRCDCTNITIKTVDVCWFVRGSCSLTERESTIGGVALVSGPFPFLIDDIQLNKLLYP